MIGGFRDLFRPWRSPPPLYCGATVAYSRNPVPERGGAEHRHGPPAAQRQDRQSSKAKPMNSARNKFIRSNAVLLLPRSAPRATSQCHQHFDTLQETSDTVALPSFRADRTTLFAEIRVNRHRPENKRQQTTESTRRHELKEPASPHRMSSRLSKPSYLTALPSLQWFSRRARVPSHGTLRNPRPDWSERSNRGWSV